MVLALEPHLYTPDEIIIHVGDKGRDMFIIKSGEVQVYIEIQGVKKELALLSKGQARAPAQSCAAVSVASPKSVRASLGALLLTPLSPSSPVHLYNLSFASPIPPSTPVAPPPLSSLLCVPAPPPRTIPAPVFRRDVTSQGWCAARRVHHVDRLFDHLLAPFGQAAAHPR